MSNGKTTEALSLHEILMGKTVVVLKDIANTLNIKSPSGERKGELVGKIEEALFEPERLCGLLYIADPAIWNCILQAYSSTFPINVPRDIEVPCKVITKLGYLQWIESDNSSVILMPQEIKGVLGRLVDEGFVGEKERGDLLDAYAMAATNLYGVISQDDFVNLFNKQNDKPTDIDEVFEVLSQHINADAPYCFWDEYITHFLFEENEFKDVKSLLATAQGKPRYIPEKDIFLKFSHPDYYEETDAHKKLRPFLAQYLDDSDENLDELMTDLSISCIVDSDLHTTLSVLDTFDLHIPQSQVRKTAELMVDLINNSRKWSNRGHTPIELHQILSPQSLSGKRKKIGRNDLCPCGSGRKYKKCCGR